MYIFTYCNVNDIGKSQFLKYDNATKYFIVLPNPISHCCQVCGFPMKLATLKFLPQAKMFSSGPYVWLWGEGGGHIGLLLTGHWSNFVAQTWQLLVIQMHLLIHFQNEDIEDEEEVEDKENKSESSSNASSSESSGSDTDWTRAESGWAHRLPETLWTEPWARGLSLLCTALFPPQEGAHPAVTHLRHLIQSFSPPLFCPPLHFCFYLFFPLWFCLAGFKAF